VHVHLASDMPIPRLVQSAACLILTLLSLSCQNAAPRVSVPSDIVSTVPSAVHLPLSIERVAILYPEASDRRLMSAYLRLEGGTFQLKELRPTLKLVERFDLRPLLDEQRWQLTSAVSDDTAVRVGHLLGVDSVALYRVEGPSVKDRALASVVGGVPPGVIVSKIIKVEDGEVVFLNAVTVPVETASDKVFLSMDSHIQAALDRGVTQTIADLRHAFRMP
jgi:hypothetical protein